MFLDAKFCNWGCYCGLGYTAVSCLHCFARSTKMWWRQTGGILQIQTSLKINWSANVFITFITFWKKGIILYSVSKQQRFWLSKDEVFVGLKCFFFSFSPEYLILNEYFILCVWKNLPSFKKKRETMLKQHLGSLS